MDSLSKTTAVAREFSDETCHVSDHILQTGELARADVIKQSAIRRARLSIVGILVLPISIIFGQEASPSPQAADRSGVTIEEVIVTGSNIPTSEEVGPNPVDTYRLEDIQKLGVRTASDLTQRLPAITGGAVNENIAIRDGRAEVNLRGLFPKETLVLVDGKRVAPVGFAQGASIDLNLIPFALIDHIDILKDGASAIYGSDAVAGVFNVFLKHKFRGLELEASLGNTNLGSSNDAAERESHLLAGTGDDKTDVVVFAEYYDRAAIFSRDRDLSSTANFTRFGGIDSRSGNFAGRVGGFVLRRGVTTPTPHSAPDAATSPDYTRRGSLQNPNPLIPTRSNLFAFDFAPLQSAIPAADREYFYGSFAREFCDKYLTVFADFKVARTFFEPTLAPVPFMPDPFKQAGGFTAVSPIGISVPLTNPFNPFTQPDIFLPDGTPATTGVRYRALEAGPRTFKFTTYDYLFDAGVRGTLGEFGDYFKTWNYEIGFRYNSNQHTQVTSGIVSQPGLRAALLDTDPLTAFNPFGRNVNTATALNRVLATTQQTGVATLTDESVALNGNIINMPAGPLSFALGSEHRKETVNDQPDALNTSFSSIGSVDFQATRASRDVWSYYGELRIPITSPTWKFPGAYSLEFQVAERVEFYSDTNLSERPKFSVRYQPFDSSLTLRAGYTEAFHAPNLSDFAPSASEGFVDVFDPATGGELSARVLEGGQPNLRPEVAYGFNYGAVWTPRFVRGLTLSADFYHIDLRDRTNFINPQFILEQNVDSGGKRFPGQVVRDPVTGEILFVRSLIQNISRTITEGFDYEAIYTLDTTIFGRGNFGTFTFTLNGNYLSRYVAAINVGDREREFAGQETGFGASFNVFGYLPHNRFYASAYYDLGGLDTGVTIHYIGQGSDISFFTINGEPRKIREWTTVDALLSYTFNVPAPVTANPVAGYAKDGGNNVGMKDGKEKSLIPVSTAEYNPCGWRAWLNGTTVTVGMNNIFDLDPPFVAGAIENGYDESIFDIKGRFWYVALKKRF
jgi:iron complex outermembrane recepter protein